MTLGEEVTGRVVLSAYAQGDTVVLEFEHGALVVIGGFAEWQPAWSTIPAVEPGTITVDKFGGTFSVEKVELPWWLPWWLSLAWFTVRHPRDAARMRWGWRQ